MNEEETKAMTSGNWLELVLPRSQQSSMEGAMLPSSATCVFIVYHPFYLAFNLYFLDFVPSLLIHLECTIVVITCQLRDTFTWRY